MTEVEISQWIAEHAFLIFLLAVWSLGWKGWALWRAARNNQPAWFFALLVLNTLGILEILYIYVFGRKQEA